MSFLFLKYKILSMLFCHATLRSSRDILSRFLIIYFNIIMYNRFDLISFKKWRTLSSLIPKCRSARERFDYAFHIFSLSLCVVRNPTYIPADVNGGKEIHKTLAKDWTEGKKREERGGRVRKLPTIPRGSAGLFKRIQLWEMALLKVTFRIDIIVETP